MIPVAAFIFHHWMATFFYGFVLIFLSKHLPLKDDERPTRTFLGKIFSATPVLKEWYWRPEDYRITTFQKEKANEEARIAGDNAALKALGIQAPTVSSPCRLDRDQFRRSELSFPEYVFREASRRQEEDLGYFVTGAASVKKAYALRRLCDIAAEVPGMWLTRDPYQNYPQVQRGGRTPSPAALAKMPAPSFEDAWRKYDFRRRFFGELFTGDDPFPIEEDGQNFRDARDFVVRTRPFLALPAKPELVGAVRLKILPSKDGSDTGMGQLLNALRQFNAPFRFEIVAEEGVAYFALTYGSVDEGRLKRFVEAALPGIVLERMTTPLRAPEATKTVELCPSSSFGEFNGPRDFPFDPLAMLLAAFDAQPEAAFSAITIDVAPLDERFVGHLDAELERLRREDFYEYDKDGASTGLGARDTKVEQRPLVKNRIKAFKSKFPGWQAWISASSTDASVMESMQQEFFRQFENESRKWVLRPLAAMPLNASDVFSTTELATLVHLPGFDAVSDRLERADAETSKPPDEYLQSVGSALGTIQYKHEARPVVLPYSVRERHVYLIGKSRTGKSTLLANLARQDIENGAGCCVIDPHGDLVEDLLSYIPRKRVNDTIYFDAKSSSPIALNVMSAESEDDIEQIASDLIVTFRRLSENWGDRMENILRYTFHTLLSIPGSTFLDIQEILQNKDFRARAVERLSSPILRQFWLEQFPSLPRDAVQPILTRMSRFLLSRTLSGILGQKESRLRLADVMECSKVLLVNLAGVGHENASLLGSVIVSQLQLAVMRRANIPKEERRPFFLYVDEFQNFTSSAFDKILSETGKFELKLNLAHQYISQLDENVRNAILGNVGTIVMFRCDDQQVAHLRNQLGSFEPADVTDLPKFHALCRPDRSSETFMFKTHARPEATRENFREEIVQNTAARYSTRTKGEQETQDPPAPAPASPPQPPPEPETDGAPQEEVASKAAAEQQPDEPSPVAPPKAKARKKAADASADTAPGVGRGSEGHKYLQYLLKKWGDSRGYKATVEKPILDGVGNVDVALESESRTIACEISVTTSAEHEVGNILKCVAGGFDVVILVSLDERLLTKAQKRLEQDLPPRDFSRVYFETPGSVFVLLKKLDKELPVKEETIKGIKVTTTYKTVAPEDEQAKIDEINKTVAQSIKRIRDKGKRS